MSLWNSAINLLTGGFVKEVGDAIDKNVTSDEERGKLKNELATITASTTIRLQELQAEADKHTVADRADARKLGAEYVKAGRRNRRQDNLAYLAVAMLMATVIAAVLVAIYADMSDGKIQAVFALLNLVIGGLMKTVGDVYGYDFGSSYGSGAKDTTIAELIKKD